MRSHDEVNQMVAERGVPKASAACMVAAVLFTYRCSIACRHCCFGCATDRPDVVMTPRQCVDALALLHETGRVIHIAGGEAMLYWNVLAEALELADEKGLAPHFIETNCSFAVNDELTRERLLFLRRHGVRGLLASTDPYHQEFVPADRFLRVRRLAIEIFGAANFYGSGIEERAVRDFETVTRDETRLRDYVRRQPPVAVGTAQRKLAPFLDCFPPDDPRLPWRGWREPYVRGTCASQFQADTLWELHIDPYGNIQTNCGMILGKVPETTPAALLASGPEKANRFVRRLPGRPPRPGPPRRTGTRLRRAGPRDPELRPLHPGENIPPPVLPGGVRAGGTIRLTESSQRQSWHGSVASVMQPAWHGSVASVMRPAWHGSPDPCEAPVPPLALRTAWKDHRRPYACLLFCACGRRPRNRRAMRQACDQ